MPERIFVEGFREQADRLRSLGFGARKRRLHDRDGLLISGYDLNLAHERLGIDADRYLSVRGGERDDYLLPRPPEVILEPYQREHMEQWSAMGPVLAEFATEHTCRSSRASPTGTSGRFGPPPIPSTSTPTRSRPDRRGCVAGDQPSLRETP